jgi:hypothetical protein
VTMWIDCDKWMTIESISPMFAKLTELSGRTNIVVAQRKTIRRPLWMQST